MSALDLASDHNKDRPQFTISTGGPATTVTWTRDSTTVIAGTEIVLDDPETAQYSHTLLVTTGGGYQSMLQVEMAWGSAHVST